MKIATKEVGKPLQITASDEEYRTDCTRKVLGEDTTVQFLRLDAKGTLFMGIDEDGLMLNLPLNFLLSVQSPTYPIQKIVGTAVFMRTKYASPWMPITDYEVEDLTDDDITYINRLLDEKHQQKLTAMFEDYGTSCIEAFFF